MMLPDATTTAMLASIDAIIRECASLRSAIVQSIPPPPPPEPLPSIVQAARIARVALAMTSPPPPPVTPSPGHRLPRWRCSYHGDDGQHRSCHVRAESARDASLLASVQLGVSRFDVEVEPADEPAP